MTIWNGGRSVLFPKEEYLSKQQIEKIINDINNLNIKLSITFTNMLLTKDHLSDPYCNMILSLLDNGFGNEIIVASDLLERYIKQNFPNLKLISSITKGSDFKTFYEALQKKSYDMIVVYSKKEILNFIINNLSEEDKKHIEILIKSPCYNCPISKYHYMIESFNNLYYKDPITYFECYRSLDQSDKIDLNDQPIEDINYLNSIGLYNFKLMGRGPLLQGTFSFYLDSIIKSEYKEKVERDLLKFL